ncbi:hypothetical protein BJ165DRAFT_739313 [Panaeolus papilionaceus]|nr:hypothetical protein BJ165DRAFT_739313 [Panaeolus papilionaceus]
MPFLTRLEVEVERSTVSSCSTDSNATAHDDSFRFSPSPSHGLCDGGLGSSVFAISGHYGASSHFMSSLPRDTPSFLVLLLFCIFTSSLVAAFLATSWLDSSLWGSYIRCGSIMLFIYFVLFVQNFFSQITAMCDHELGLTIIYVSISFIPSLDFLRHVVHVCTPYHFTPLSWNRSCPPLEMVFLSSRSSTQGHA